MTIQELNAQTKAELKKNVSSIFADIERIKKENKIEKEVTLLAATKTVPADVINYTTQVLGIRHIGENKVQELVDKYDKLSLEGVKVHFIGKLQTNKVKYIIDKVDLIHSLDSVKLACEIDKRAKRIGKVMDVLVEINSGREENKSGIYPEDVQNFLEEIKDLENIRVKGFMTIAPVCSEKTEYRKYFAETYRILIDNLAKKSHNIDVCILSMGMTNSYEAAIEEGSDIVRIGSAIYGSRY